MSTTETPVPAQPGPAKRSGWRRFFVGSALVLSGIIIGVGTSALSQGYHRGWSDDGPGRYERFDGPRGFFRDHDGPGRWFGRDRDHDGPGRWFGRDRDHDGPGRWFGRDRDDDGPRGWRGGHRFGGFDGAFLTPGRIERMVARFGWAVDASSEQKQKLTAIIQRAGEDLRPLRERHLELRRQAAEILAAPTIDRAKLEALRTDVVKLADQASQRITAALAEAAEVLTPEQRANLARRMERFRRG
jgi:periplasmic protein CpxP/Spy